MVLCIEAQLSGNNFLQMSPDNWREALHLFGIITIQCSFYRLAKKHSIFHV